MDWFLNMMAWKQVPWQKHRGMMCFGWGETDSDPLEPIITPRLMAERERERCL